MTQCDWNYMEWLLINATLKYTLLASHDYNTAPPQRDASCPSTSASVIVGPGLVNGRWHFLEG